jgi:hypothetical protein
MDTGFKVLILETYHDAKRIDISLLSSFFIDKLDLSESQLNRSKVALAKCDYAVKELEEWIEVRGGVNLFDLTKHLDPGKWKTSNSINLTDIEIISNAIEEARKVVLGKLIKMEPLIAPGKPDGTTPKLTIDQVALFHVYEGLPVTRENAEGIVKQYGHTSGDALFNKFIKFSATTNRIGKPQPNTPQKLQNKINLIGSVIPLLSEPKKQRAIDEQNILKKIFENEFE